MPNCVRKILGAGNPPLSAQNISGDASSGLTGLGSTQATALLQQSDCNEFTTVASSTGFVLNSLNTPGDEVFVANAGASPLSVYPELGASINALAANTAFSVTNGKSALFIKMTPTKYYSILSA